MRSQPTMRLFQTLPHACGYFDDRTAQNVVLDPASRNLRSDYARALPLGFRRAGGHVYRPHCEGCRACVACRIAVADFVPDRSQRRCFARNRDIEMIECRPGRSPEHLALYAAYLRQRHPDGGMDPASSDDFDSFLVAPWSPTVFLELRAGGRLLAVAVTDVCPSGLSAVYTFFDPAERARSLGTYAILRQIELARARDLPYLYLGYWIAGHPKMDYKSRFQPLQVLDAVGWHTLKAPPDAHG
ncbi:MAG TPA: arginyltransferase [Rhodanobacteraceae bacterium]|nr:arginyltransferase [Rhodanobacteraceae bacterium]